MTVIATRNERVVLTLEDNFTSGMAKAAASAQMLSRELNGLSGQSVQSRGLSAVSRDMDRVGASARRNEKEIDRFSGRLGLLRDVALTIGPAFVPIGALAVPAVTGLAAQLGAAALAGGTMVVAFQGVGTALEAVNKAALEPTAQNLEAARIAMQNLGPEAQSLVSTIQEFRPALLELRNAAAAGLFPGLERSIGELSGALPAVEGLLYRIGDAAGGVAEEFAAGIAGPRGQEFLSFLSAEMPQAITTLGRTIGNLAGGMAELWQAFTPLNNDFAGWLLEASRGFDSWAQGLSKTQGFQEFVAYVRNAGPQVAEAMGAIGNAVLQVVQAVAPLGGPVLSALTAFANGIAAIANSPAGPALVTLASGLVLVNRAMATFAAIKAAPVISALATSSASAAGSMSALKGGGLAAAVGITAAVTAGTKLVDLFREDLPGVQQLTGMLMDLQSGDIGSLPEEFDSLAESVERITNPSLLKGQVTSDTILGAFGAEGRTLAIATDEIEAIEAALINMVALEGPKATEEAFAALAADAGMGAEAIAQARDLMPGYTDALAGAENQMRATGDAAGQTGREIAAGFNQGTSAAQEFRNAVDAANAALTGRASMRDYEQAIDDFKPPKNLDNIMSGPGGTINIDLKGGREVQAQLDAIAQSALAVAENLRGADRARFLARARADFIAAARDLGLTRAQAQGLADQLGLLDRKRARPKVDLLPGTTPAETAALMRALEELDNKHAKPQATLDYSDVQAGINAVTNLLNSISGRSVETTVTTHYQTTGSPSGSDRFRPGLALGGSVPKTGLPYADRHLYMLADGEEIISNRFGQADRYRRALKLMNAGAPADIVRQYLANGGTTGGPQYQDRRVYNNSSSTTSVSPRVNVGGSNVRVFIDGREVRNVAVQEANRVVNAQQDLDNLMGGS